MRSREEKRAYARGYNAAASWPEHRPPEPPNDIVAGVIRAARKLRDVVDAEIATWPQDEQFVERAGSAIDALDEQMAEVGRWIKGPPDSEQES